MKLERTGVNEPAIALDLLKEMGFVETEQISLSMNETTLFPSRNERRRFIIWVMYGELEILPEAGMEGAILTGGDHLTLDPGESIRCTAGKPGTGYLLAWGETSQS